MQVKLSLKKTPRAVFQSADFGIVAVRGATAEMGGAVPPPHPLHGSPKHPGHPPALVPPINVWLVRKMGINFLAGPVAIGQGVMLLKRADLDSA